MSASNDTADFPAKPPQCPPEDLVDVDPRMRDLLTTRLTSFIKWDVLRFFHENPQTTETAERIADEIGRHVDVVEPELIQLARHSLLEMETLTGLRVYTLSDDPDTRQLIHEFFTACNDRRFRLKAVYHVIQQLH
jgi:hypothetical protein